MKKGLLVLALVGCLASSASADNWVWFQTADAGAQGQVLELSVDVGARATWNVAMMLSSDEALTGWAEDLWGDTTQLSAANLAYGNFPAPSASSAGVAVNAGGVLTQGSFGQNFVAPFTPPGLYTLFTFDLTWAPTVAGLDLYINNIIGSNGWGNTVYPYYVPMVHFAGGPLFYCGAGADAGPVIHLQSTPEPATLVLLGFGALALIRRR